MSGMSVVYVKATGHVVAAATHSAAPAKPIPVADLVGAELPFRVIGDVDVDVRLPVDQLDAAGVDSDINVSVRPYGFRVKPTTTNGEIAYEVEQQTDVALTIGSTANRIVVGALPATTDLVLVVVQPATAGGPAPVLEELDPNGATSVTTAATFATGRWSVVVFATGAVPKADEVPI